MATTEIDDDSSPIPQTAFTPLYLIGFLLAAITGAIHLWTGITGSSLALTAAGVGFMVGIVAVIADIRRESIINFGIPYTAVQTVYYLATHFDQITWLSAVDKVVQIGLIVVLVMLAKRQ